MPTDPRNFDSLVKTLVRPSVRLTVEPIDDAIDLALTDSKFGGLPFLEDQRWPTCNSCSNGLAFICQFNLRTLAPDLTLPFDLFSFFYCHECMPMSTDDSPGMWAVRISKLPGTSTAQLPVDGCANEDHHCTPCSVSAARVPSLPDWQDDILSDELRDLSGSLNPDEPWEPYQTAAATLVGEPSFTSHIGGYPQWVQGGESFECSECGEPLSLFVEIATELDANLMWGDSGSVYLFHCPNHPASFTFCLQCL